MTSAASADLSRHLWETRYRATGTDGTLDADLDATWRRVARALAAAGPRQRAHWARSFHAALADFRLLPGGRILAGAGTRRRATLFNCFVMGTLGDSLRSIFRGLGEGALTMQQGGGLGYDFSPLRPRGSRAGSSGAIAPGPVSFSCPASRVRHRPERRDHTARIVRALAPASARDTSGCGGMLQGTLPCASTRIFAATIEYACFRCRQCTAIAAYDGSTNGLRSASRTLHRQRSSSRCGSAARAAPAAALRRQARR